MSLGGDVLALNECGGAVDLCWRTKGLDVRCSMSDFWGGLAYSSSLSNQLLLSPGVLSILAEQLGGKGFSVPALSRFSRAFFSPLPPFPLPRSG
jgi:hypothetical protein